MTEQTEQWVGLVNGAPYISEATQRARARAKVAEAARHGDRPQDAWLSAEIAWAFGEEHAEELAELDALAIEVSEAKRERERANAAARALHDETQRVVQEWKRAEDAKIWARAEAEARKRLTARDDQ